MNQYTCEKQEPIQKNGHIILQSWIFRAVTNFSTLTEWSFPLKSHALCHCLSLWRKVSESLENLIILHTLEGAFSRKPQHKCCHARREESLREAGAYSLHCLSYRHLCIFMSVAPNLIFHSHLATLCLPIDLSSAAQRHQYDMLRTFNK